MSEPNFIIVNDRNTFGQLEVILSEYKTLAFDWGLQTKNHKQIENIVSLLDLIDLDDSKFSKIIDLFSRIQNFDRFKSFFELKPTLDTQFWSSNDVFIEVKGASQTGSVNYLTFLFLKFFESKDAFSEIFRHDIRKDEFGNYDLKKWDRKFERFFKKEFFDLVEFKGGEKFFKQRHKFKEKESYLHEFPKSSVDNFYYMSQIYEEIKALFLAFTYKYVTSGAEVNWNKETPKQKGENLENQCLEILVKNGWNASLTPSSNDQGADIIAKKGLITLVLQCKNYRKPAGNDAIQQVFAAKSFFEGTIAAVVSPSGFTKSAIELSKKTDVLLMSMSDLNKI